jgi:hypothetical protein
MRRRLASRRALFATAAVAALTFTAFAMPAAAGPGAGFKTGQAAMLTPVAPGVSVEPILTVGETLPGTDYVFESIPDGIALQRHDNNRVDVYVNHELSTVPFPFTPATPANPIGTGFNDFANAMLSKLSLNRDTAGVLAGEYVIPSEANYHRFCSNFIATKEHGFERPILFTNEEATDFVNRTGTSWPAGPNAEQAGVVVAYDVRTGKYHSIYGMGRHNHENSVAVPGYGYPAVYSGDDTFSAPASQLYLYTARSARAVLKDQGQLWAFKGDNGAVNDYGDLAGAASTSGRFIPVPRDIALGDQTGLENWSNANNVFQFIRVEDIAYDRKHENVLYFADTGEPRALPDPATTRLRRGPSGTMGPYPNGRIFKMVLDPSDPTRVLSLSILIDGDSLGAAGAGNVALIHQPDNVETSGDLLLFQEDPGSQNQYAITNPAGTTARIWGYNLRTGGSPFVVARVDQSADEGPTDKDASTTKANAGAWESSGIVDASDTLGPGTFLVDIQAGSLIVEEEVRMEGPNRLTYQREGGQLLVLRMN